MHAHTHTRTRTHPHTPTHTHTDTNTQKHTQTHTNSHTQTQTLTQTYTQIHTQTHAERQVVPRVKAIHLATCVAAHGLRVFAGLVRFLQLLFILHRHGLQVPHVDEQDDTRVAEREPDLPGALRFGNLRGGIHGGIETLPACCRRRLFRIQNRVFA